MKKNYFELIFKMFCFVSLALGDSAVCYYLCYTIKWANNVIDHTPNLSFPYDKIIFPIICIIVITANLIFLLILLVKDLWKFFQTEEVKARRKQFAGDRKKRKVEKLERQVENNKSKFENRSNEDEK